MGPLEAHRFSIHVLHPKVQARTKGPGDRRWQRLKARNTGTGFPSSMAGSSSPMEVSKPASSFMKAGISLWPKPSSCWKASADDSLRAYFDRYVPLAVDRGVGFILESPTWRANPEWGAKIGFDRHRLAEVNSASIDLMHEIRAAYATERTPLVISGCVGPRGDGYAPGPLMSPGEAEVYHGWQISLFRDCGCDFVSAITMTNIK